MHGGSRVGMDSRYAQSLPRVTVEQKGTPADSVGGAAISAVKTKGVVGPQFEKSLSKSANTPETGSQYG